MVRPLAATAWEFARDRRERDDLRPQMKTFALALGAAARGDSRISR